MSRWLRTASGDRWHLMVVGKPICGVPASTVVVTTEPTDHERRCGNCDKEWRKRGRANRPTKKLSGDRTTYRPRFTIADFEAGR